MKQDTTYQGFINYETWNYCLHVDNNQEQLNYVLDLARQFKNSETPNYDLSQYLKAEIEENIPDLEVNVYSDLLWAAIENINWYEVANHYLEKASEV